MFSTLLSNLGFAALRLELRDSSVAHVRAGAIRHIVKTKGNKLQSEIIIIIIILLF